MGAPSKRAKKIRTASEFDTARLKTALSVPKGSGVSLTSWTLAEIFAARDSQLRGDFYRPARMAESMRTDDALAVALENRLAPQKCIKVEVVAAPKDKSGKVRGEAEALFGQCGVGVSPDTLASIHECLVNHEIAFAQMIATPREDGSRVDFELHAWPIEHVRWDSYERCYLTRVDLTDGVPAEEGTYGGDVRIVHGDGRWVIFQRYEIDPFKHGALLSAALVWARHAYAIRDWAKGSVAHGSAKVLGSLPEGVPLQDAEGSLSAEASALADLLRSFASSDAPVGIKPAGATVEFLTNQSTAWQVWSELVDNAEKAAARIYLGTDGTLGTQGGAPGVDIESLFGVAATKVQGDLECISRGLQTMIEIWCAVNFGDSTLAPVRRYMLPDADSDADRASEATRTTAFYDEIDRAKASGFAVTQEVVDRIAEKHGIPTMQLAAAPAAAAPAPAPTPALRRV